jgi:hypothetical protein
MVFACQACMRRHVSAMTTPPLASDAYVLRPTFAGAAHAEGISRAELRMNYVLGLARKISTDAQCDAWPTWGSRMAPLRITRLEYRHPGRVQQELGAG